MPFPAPGKTSGNLPVRQFTAFPINREAVPEFGILERLQCIKFVNPSKFFDKLQNSR